MAGFGLFIIVEFIVLKLLSSFIDSCKINRYRREAIKEGKRFYFDLATNKFRDANTGKVVSKFYETSKYGDGHYCDPTTGEIIGYFGSPHPDYTTFDERFDAGVARVCASIARRKPEIVAKINSGDTKLEGIELVNAITKYEKEHPEECAEYEQRKKKKAE